MQTDPKIVMSGGDWYMSYAPQRTKGDKKNLLSHLEDLFLLKTFRGGEEGVKEKGLISKHK